MKRLSLTVLALLACAACDRAAEPQLEKAAQPQLENAAAPQPEKATDPQPQKVERAVDSLARVRKEVVEKLPDSGITGENITLSVAPGLYQVQKGSEFGYVTADGRYLIFGDMLDLQTGEQVTERLRSESRLTVLKQFGPDQVIEFAPKDPKYFITVFTDIDCGYCRKLHSEIKQYNEVGIGVRYVFFPRSGPNSPSFEEAEQVWCSADRREALTQAKLGIPPKAAGTCRNPVQQHYAAGEAIGINATPTLVLPDGEIVRGYVPAVRLAARLAHGSTKVTRR